MLPPTAQAEVEAAIFEVALSLEDAETRQRFLARAFAEDPVAIARMNDLLEAARDATSFFLDARETRGDLAAELMEEMPDFPPPDEMAIHPQAGAPRSSASIGEVIGGYRLIRCLGEGGSGVVYEAEQTHPVQRRVALKLIHADLAGDAAGHRFDLERQALAIMDHPNIAKVLDAGGHHRGSPYFVMELVEGEAITRYCDRKRLDVRARIELFTEVCGAIQHAHSKRIIHRDIKPSNVLVTVRNGAGIAKVIDFGIAKPVAREFRGAEMARTGHDHLLGTPAYMSPEQVEMIGMDVDTRSDIYSLGVLLYELLSSRTPFDRQSLADAGLASMRKTLLENRHPKPSSKLSEIPGPEAETIAAARHTDLPRLLSAIRGDLDWIVMKALEKDRNQRYETANALAMDLRRFLEDKPVSARRPGNLYVLGKFIKRNKTSFYSATAVAASVLLGFGVSTTLYFREKEAVREQERLGAEAARARDQEFHLRRQAQARANVSRVAFLLAEGQVEEADSLLRENPLVSIEPSKEASSVFRVLGNWYGNYGRWPDAVQCFRLMEQATRMNNPRDILRGQDLLTSAPALLLAGDMRGYQDFRTRVLARHLPVQDSLEAEHLLKACLLKQPSPEELHRLESAARLCRETLDGKAKGRFPAWEAFSLALYHHRRQEDEKVIEVGARGLAMRGIKEVCAGGLHALTAMAHHRLGTEAAAMDNLKRAAEIIRKPAAADAAEENAILPRWYDAATATLLLQEAELALRPR